MKPIGTTVLRIVFVVKLGLFVLWSASCVYFGFQVRPIVEQGIDAIESVQKVYQVGGMFDE
jgi:hypothetical protein